MNIFTVLHGLLVLYILGTPHLSSDPNMLKTHLLVVGFILAHWATNNDTCCLTELERKLFPACKQEDLFMNRLVGRVYRVDNTDLKEGMLLLLFWSYWRYIHFAP